MKQFGPSVKGKEEKIQEIFGFLIGTKEQKNIDLAVKIMSFTMRSSVENFLYFNEAYLEACFCGNEEIANICREIANEELILETDVKIPYVWGAIADVGTRFLQEYKNEESKEVSFILNIDRKE